MTRWLAFALCLAQPACGDGPAAPDASVVADATDDVDCAITLEGRSFKGPFLECDVCQCGASIRCDAHVTFDQGSMDGSYSDRVLSGSYTCTNDVITVTGDSTVYGSYDRLMDRVVFEQYEFEACPGTCDLRVQTCDEVCPTTGP